MRIEDILHEARDLNALAQAIEAGEAPTIINATWWKDGYAWGDLKELGWAQKRQRRVQGSIWEVSWTYTGPNSITVQTHGAEPYVLHTGESTPGVEVDYS